MITERDLLGLDIRERRRVDAVMQRRDTVFVFGSNRAGQHGGGAARAAWKLWGALWGVGEGLQGRSYAIPTKDDYATSLTLDQVAGHVTTFLIFATQHPKLTFAVTRIGCGLAGFTDVDIAPLFKTAPANCELPEGWR